MSETRPGIEVWYLVGLAERCVLGRYIWRDGYSLRPDGGMQPWQTKKEALKAAKASGKRAVFVRSNSK